MYTKGPWKVKPGFGFLNICAGQKPIARMVELWSTDNAEEMTKVERKANARLIAAAPMLYEACEAVLSYLRTHQVYDKDARSVLERAIAAAKGESDAAE